MKSTVKFSAERGGPSQIAQSREMQQDMLARVEAGKSFAESIAPVRTGRYRGSFVATTREVSVPGTGKVTAGVLSNTAPNSMLVEVHNKSYVLTRTLGVMTR